MCPTNLPHQVDRFGSRQHPVNPGIGSQTGLGCSPDGSVQDSPLRPGRLSPTR